MSAVADVLAELSGAAGRLGWQKFGACRNSDEDQFYPERGSRARVREAKATCATCPVKDACLSWAMATNEQHGVWGGLTRRERIELRARQKAARAASSAPTPAYSGAGAPA